MRWRRVLDSFAFAVAIGLAVWIRYGLAMSGYAAVGAGVVAFLVIPFVGSGLVGLFMIRRADRFRKL